MKHVLGNALDPLKLVPRRKTEICGEGRKAKYTPGTGDGCAPACSRRVADELTALTSGSPLCIPNASTPPPTCRCGRPLDPRYTGVGRTLCQECHDQVCDRDTGEQRDKRQADSWERDADENIG
jgi:hypothetical protein